MNAASFFKKADLILTPNQRLASYLKSTQMAGPALPVYALRTGLEKLWNDLSDLYRDTATKILLSPRLIETLWAKILGLNDTHILLNIPNTLESIHEAREMLGLWGISASEFKKHVSTEETQFFLRAYIEYEKTLKESQWLDFPQLVKELSSIFLNAEIPSPKHLALVGFQEIPREVESLLDTLQSKGCRITKHQLSSYPKNKTKCSFSEGQHELHSVAHWVKARIEEAPQSRVGVVIPELSNQREKIISLFEKVLEDISFNVSAPVPITEFPMIESALWAIERSSRGMTFQDVVFWLKSPFFHNTVAKALDYAEYENKLKYVKESFYSLEALKKAFGDTRLAGVLCELEPFFEAESDSRYPSEWLCDIQERLNILGWPGDRVLTSEEYQQMQHWGKVLREYARLDLFLKKHVYREAIAHIKRLLEKSTFLPKTENSNIQILGVFEAVGMPFDHLWVSGMDETHWPNPPSPNPFIPLVIQKKWQLPRSCHEREWKVAKDLFKQFSEGATHSVIFSYSKTHDEINLKPSVLLESLPDNHEMVCGVQNSVQMKNAPIVLEKFSNTVLQSALPKAVGLGGARLLQLQAQCPFRAFAEIRLSAKPRITPTLGLSPIDRGTVMHEILAEFWNIYREHRTVSEMSQNALNQTIEEIVLCVLRRWKGKKTNSLRGLYHDIEWKRLSKAVRRWVELEKMRAPFRVCEIESTVSLTLGPITLDLRIDRIDTLHTGEKVIIDYKTGEPSLAECFGERPSEPQLPLYALAQEKKPLALTFAILKSNKMQFKGIGGETLDEIGVREIADWDTQFGIWRRTLEELAIEFHQGVSSVSPKDGKNTCSQCSLQSLCRIGEA